MNRPVFRFTDGRTLEAGTCYCIGRNYAKHAAEMGAVVPTDPIVFLKPPAALRHTGESITLPSWSQDVHHEVELVVVIGEHGSIAGYAVGIDLTARDVQLRAKQLGEPWAVAKAWNGSAPVSDVVPADDAGHGPWTLTLDVNGVTKQAGTTADMERTVDALVAYLHDVFTLQPGDCIFTGTPEGVGPVHRGDHVVARLDDLTTVTVEFI
jgi:2-keto-4-pentenoate hydratase/2-oxohepta-3-ene-1,7-dioic acid hydratase in catechol pathway